MAADQKKRQLHIVHTESSLGWGGQEMRILSEALGFMQRGHRLTLLTPSSSTIYGAAIKAGYRNSCPANGKETPEGCDVAQKMVGG